MNKNPGGSIDLEDGEGVGRRLGARGEERMEPDYPVFKSLRRGPPAHGPLTAGFGRLQVDLLLGTIDGRVPRVSFVVERPDQPPVPDQTQAGKDLLRPLVVSPIPISRLFADGALTPRAKVLIRSELTWVWTPAILLLVLVRTLRQARSALRGPPSEPAQTPPLRC